MMLEVIFGFHLSNQATFSSITPSITRLLYHSISALEKLFISAARRVVKTARDGPLGRLPSVWQHSCIDKTSGGQSD